MQDKWCPYHASRDGSHYSASALANSASTSILICTCTLVEEQWSPAITPTTENRSSSLTGPSGITENVDYPAYGSSYPATPNILLPEPLMDHAHSTEARSRLWQSDKEGMTAHAHVAHAFWNETGLGPIQLERSQVPSESTDLDNFGQSWSQCGRDRHAVQEARAQPALQVWRDAHYTPRSLPSSLHVSALPESSASSHADIAALGNVGPWVADPVPWQAPSHSIRRRHRRYPHSRAEIVTCDRCLKSMRQQSLKRHVREVHHHIKRPHPKSSSAAQPRP